MTILRVVNPSNSEVLDGEAASLTWTTHQLVGAGYVERGACQTGRVMVPESDHHGVDLRVGAVPGPARLKDLLHGVRLGLVEPYVSVPRPEHEDRPHADSILTGPCHRLGVPGVSLVHMRTLGALFQLTS